MRRFIAWGMLAGLAASAALCVPTARAALPAYIWVNPPKVAFGDVAIGSSASQVFVLTNIGGRQTGILQTTLAGPDPDQYRVVSDTCSGRRLRPGDSCSLTVAFVPTFVGRSDAQANVTSDNPIIGVFPLFTGYGVPAA